ncbi:MAG: MBOAT family O-acyltransferase [Eubacteriales bacterium]|nr:MBOAT family O-acyltransferase [Eubacteriales bacterium]
MSITSFPFLCLFAVSLVLYYAVPKRAQWVFLLLLSAGFFAASDEVSGGGWYLFLYPLAAVAAVYIAAILIDRTAEQKKKRAALVCAVVFCVGLLCTLKFFRLGLLAPMGISFYTLTLLGYLFDVYYEIGPVQKNYARLVLFGCYFPTMVSGPILKYGEMEKQLYQGQRLDYKRITFGMQRMLMGFFKKLVISERMALVANEVFNHYDSYRGLSVWVGAVAFTFQLYTDFDGCMDIVLGLSECFGIRLPENFNAPFLSRSISEYWRRWHISLGNWLKDYLFYPLLRTRFFMELPKKLKGRLGKKMAKRVTTFAAMFILWFAIGYWHGGTWNFIIGSGLLHWFYIVSGELLEPQFAKWRAFFGIRAKARGFVFFQRLRTFALVTLGLVFFRSATVPDAVRMIARGFSGLGLELFAPGVLSGLGMDWIECVIVLVSLLFSSWVTIRGQKEDVRERLAQRPLLVRWAVLYALLFYVILLGKYGPDFSASEFIYQNFKV